MQWDHRVRVAQVQNLHLWYLSLANGPEKSYESFFDGSTNHETQSFQVTTTPLAAAVAPVTAAGSDTSFHPPGISKSVSLAQPHLSVTTQESLDTSEPRHETTDLDTTQGYGGIDSFDDNDSTASHPLTKTKTKTKDKGKAIIKSFSCAYHGFSKSFTKKAT